jgi:glutaredoxin
MKTMKQQCYLFNVWGTWLGIPALAIVMGVLVGWWATIFVLIVGVFAQIFFIKIFPQMSRLLGYGSVEDVAAEPVAQAEKVSKVTLYTANVCPFCPIVKRRLIELQSKMGFQLEDVDITFQPGVIREKGFKSVPVVEVEGRYWVGNATSAQLAAFLTNRTENT